MKIKRVDLDLLVQYLEKEKPEMVDIVTNDENFQAGVSFSFEDVEKRQCVIKLYSASLNITPLLTKSMPLHSRLKKQEKKDDC